MIHNICIKQNATIIFSYKPVKKSLGLNKIEMIKKNKLTLVNKSYYIKIEKNYFWQ